MPGTPSAGRPDRPLIALPRCARSAQRDKAQRAGAVTLIRSQARSSEHLARRDAHPARPVGGRHGAAPDGADLAQHHRARRRPDQHPPLLDVQLAGLELARAAGSAGRTGPSPSRSPRNVVQAPGSGVTDRTSRSTAAAGAAQSTCASATVIFGACETPSAGCGRGTSVPSAIPSSVATSSAAPERASRPSRSPAVSVGAIGLGHHAVHRPGVEPFLQPERGRAGDLVTVPHGGLHRRGTPPRGQQREVQVDPAVPGHVQRGPRDERAVGDDRAAVGGERAQRVEELRVGRPPRGEHREPGLVGQRPDRRPDHPPPAPGGGVRPGQHGDDLVPGVQQGAQRRDGRLGRAGEQQAQPRAGPARRSLTAVTGPSRTADAG